MFPRPKEVKHIACSRCRERKVKCDGGKPACRRCQRLGHECQYIQGKKQQSKGEWIQHLGMFNAQLGKTVPAISSPTQRYASPSPYPVQSSPTNSISTSDAEPAITYSKPSNPYLVLSSSQPHYMIPDAESPFSKSDNMEPAVPPVPSPESLPINREVLNSQMFTFNPSHSWHNASYTSDLLTTNSDRVSSRNGWDMEGEHDCGGNGYGAFHPSVRGSPPFGFTSTTADTADWRRHYMTSSPISHGW